MRKATTILAVTAALSLMASCSGEGGGMDAAQAFSVIRVTTDTMDVPERYSASIKGCQDVDIYPQVEGKITAIKVREGQSVRAGQVLFVLDRVPYQAAVRTAEANIHAAEAQVATARLDVNSKKMLFDKNIISEYELSTARNALAVALSGVEQAKAALTNARNSLSYTEVKSPTNGMVGTLPYRIGALAGPSMTQPLTTISDNGDMYVYFAMTENQLRARVREYGSIDKALNEMPPISLELNDGSMYEHTGRIETVSGVINPQTGTLQLRSVFPNPEKLLWSGGIGNVVIPRTKSDAVVIPQTATVEIQDKILVFKVKDGVARAVYIKVQPVNDGHRYVVTEGLAVGDSIISEGVGLVHDGQHISVKK